MLKSQINRKVRELTGDLLALEELEQEARSARAVAEQAVLTLEPELTKFDEDIAINQDALRQLETEQAGVKQEIKNMERWTFEATKGKQEMERLQQVISAAVNDPSTPDPRDELERLSELGGRGFGNPQAYDTELRAAKVRIEDLKDLIRDFQRELGELQAKKREASNQYRQAEAQARQARSQHEAAKTRVQKVAREIATLKAKLGTGTTTEAEVLAEQGPVERFL